MAWCRVSASGKVNGVVEYTELTDDLLGRHLIVHFTRGRIYIDADEHPDYDLREVIERLVRGVGRVALTDVVGIPVPIAVDTLTETWGRDIDALQTLISCYQDRRQQIDDVVSQALSAAV